MIVIGSLVDGAEKKPDRGNTDGLAYVDPLSIPSGPRALLLLNGMCFGAHVDRYEYTVCPFQNVTQRRIVGTRSTLLGKIHFGVRNRFHGCLYIRYLGRMGIQ